MTWRSALVRLAAVSIAVSLSNQAVVAQMSLPDPTELAMATPVDQAAKQPSVIRRASREELMAYYAARKDGRHRLASIDLTKVDGELVRQRVAFKSEYEPGTIIINTAERRLYLIEDGGTAMRYAIAVGRRGFDWTGEGHIERTAKWPTWTPPSSMISRDPKLSRWRRGMPGSPRNPLGARALYIYFGNQDSLYRIHGTNSPRSIGTASSSGCFRMYNQDVIDLHQRVALGAKVVVL